MGSIVPWVREETTQAPAHLTLTPPTLPRCGRGHAEVCAVLAAAGADAAVADAEGLTALSHAVGAGEYYVL